MPCSIVSDSLPPHGRYPTRLLCPWTFPGKDTGVGCHFFLQENLSDPRIKATSPVLTDGFLYHCATREAQTRKIGRINKTKRWGFEKVNKTEKPLARLIQRA